jgi:hypothetical protein
MRCIVLREEIELQERVEVLVRPNQRNYASVRADLSINQPGLTPQFRFVYRFATRSLGNLGNVILWREAFFFSSSQQQQKRYIMHIVGGSQAPIKPP